MFEKPNGVDYINHHKKKLRKKRKDFLLYAAAVLTGSILLCHNQIPGLKNPKPYKAKPRYTTEQDSVYEDSSAKRKNFYLETEKFPDKSVQKKTLDSLID